MSSRLPRALTAAALLLAVGTSAWLYPELPARMATHWDALGSVDGSMPKALVAVVVPAITVGVIALLYLVPRFDPRRQHLVGFRGVYEWFIAGLVVFMAYIHGLVLDWNLGAAVPIGQAIAPAFAALFIGLGLVLRRVRSNWIIGIRTPWTLSSDAVWAATHRQGSVAFIVAGILALGGVIWPWSSSSYPSLGWRSTRPSPPTSHRRLEGFE